MKSLFLLAAVALSLTLHAAEPAPSPTEAKSSSPTPSPTDASRVSVTEHTITINGQVLKYKATAGYITLSDETPQDAKPDPAASPTPEAGKPKARVFFTAYTREDVDPATRPVAFAFNGGPGSASVWLHLGGLGPRRVKLDQLAPNSGPPYTLVDNDQTWLTDTDLVFIDPVSTGYSRPAPGATAAEFHGYQEDVKSIGEFIRLYVTKNNRWLSPKFIIGESYGGMRSAGLSDYLQNKVSMYLDGIIVVSGLFNWQYIDYAPANDIAFCQALPSFASTAWHYRKDAPEYQQRDVSDVCRTAEDFAMNDYLLALASGDKLADADRRQIAERLSKLIGLPADYILLHHLRVTSDDFRIELLKSDARIPGGYDSRYNTIAYNPDDDSGDASAIAIRGACAAAINSYLRGELKFDSDLPYNVLTSVQPWSYKSDNRYLDVSGVLGRAMTENPRLKVWILTGHFDLVVPYFSTRYTLTHMHLDPAIRQNVTFSEYDSGHMIYIDQSAIKAMRDDFSKFLRSATNAR